MAKPKKKKSSATDAPMDEPPSEQRALVPTVSLETLEETPERMLTFLRGVGTVPAIYAILNARGYTPEVHERGWALLDASSGRVPVGVGAADAHNPRIREAIIDIDAIDEPFVRILAASLRRHFPDVAEVILNGIEPSTGMGAVVVVSTVLDRIEAFAKGDHEKREEVLKLIAARGYPEEERKRMRDLVEVARSVPDVVPADPEALAQAERRRIDSLVRLRSWYEEWSDIARSTIKRRGDLIRLGLASRRRNTEKRSTDAAGEDTETA